MPIACRNRVKGALRLYRMKVFLRCGYAERSFLTTPHYIAPSPTSLASPCCTCPSLCHKGGQQIRQSAGHPTGQAMTKTISLKLTEDELEMLVDALEVDLEGYLESAKEARGNNNREDVKTFTEAAQRIQELTEKLRALLPEL
jgi:hypothetical protein